MRVRLPYKLKPSNYTESRGIDAAGRWGERNVSVPGEICMKRSERSNRGHIKKTALNMQKSAEAIVPETGRAEPTQAGVTGERRPA